jgi:hypothetical protein
MLHPLEDKAYRYHDVNQVRTEQEPAEKDAWCVFFLVGSYALTWLEARSGRLAEDARKHLLK